MSVAPGKPAAAQRLPLHTVWYMVVRPAAVALPGGAVGMDAVAQTETLAQASAIANTMPGAQIVMNVIVHDVPAGKIIRSA